MMTKEEVLQLWVSKSKLNGDAVPSQPIRLFSVFFSSTCGARRDTPSVRTRRGNKMMRNYQGGGGGWWTFRAKGRKGEEEALP